MIDEVKVGDIFQSSWGYECTNVDFYKVVKKSKTMVTLRKLKSLTRPDGEQAMAGFSTPTDEFDSDDLIRRKVFAYSDEPIVKIESYAYARQWNGKPSRTTWYG
jgi:hypothetical protein